MDGIKNSLKWLKIPQKKKPQILLLKIKNQIAHIFSLKPNSKKHERIKFGKLYSC